MLTSRTIQALIQHPDSAEALFKPIQRGIIEKLAAGKDLDENEKRYLRGNLGRKLTAIESLIDSASDGPTLSHPILQTLDNYYISGFEALRQNGFGWYYDTKTVVVINTRLNGSISFNGKLYQFVRVRSLQHRQWQQDERTGLRYATNEQIIKDARELKNELLERTCLSLLDRYGGLFAKITSPSTLVKRVDVRPVSLAEYGV